MRCVAWGTAVAARTCVTSASVEADGRVRDRRTLLVLAGICSVLILAGLALTIGGGGLSTSRLTLGDVSNASIVELRDHRGVTVVSGEFRSRVDLLGDTEKDAALMDRGGQTIVGEVELEIPALTREGRRPELEVDVTGLAPRAKFTVVIDDRSVAEFVTDDRGSIDRELQEGEVPAATPDI
jgi:hypothetical protein